MRSGNINRRAFGKLSFAAGVLPLTFGRESYGKNEQKDDHFFLQVIIGSGMDQSYMFDARPLELTQAGKYSNYLGQEPDVWETKSGGKTLASPLTRPLKHLADDITIINGVHMAQDFAGHGQNLNYLLSGNPFGGNWFGPYISQKASSSLDFLQMGILPDSTLKNAGNSLNLSAKDAGELAVAMRSVPRIHDSTLGQFILNRMEHASRKKGPFSKGSHLMHQGLLGQTKLKSYFARMHDLEESSYRPSSSVHGSMNVVSKYFRSGFTNSVIFAPFHYVDTHDAKSAKKAPELYEAIVSDIKEILDFLKNSPYDESRSLLDVTTVCIASEFGRTMGQKSKPVDDTGTDHNPLANSIIMAGKNVRTGQVIGQTDLQTIEDFENVSKVHKDRDKDLLSVMGLPYDYSLGRTDIDARPEHYDSSHYIHFANIANSILSNFGISSQRMWKKEINSSIPAPSIPGLFK